LVLGDLGDDIAGVIDGWGVPVVHEASGLAAHGIAAPKVLGHGELAFDLRRDPQAARARLRARVLPWRWPVLAGLAAAGLWSAGQFLAIDRLDEQRRELAAASTDLVRTHFVAQGPILDIRAQVSRALAERRASTAAPQSAVGPMEVFGRAAAVLTAQSARIGQVSYGRQQGLELVATVADFAALDRLTEALAAEGLTVTVAQSRSVADGAEARLGLMPGGAPPGAEGKP
jgi:general secretion pathway protein L